MIEEGVLVWHSPGATDGDASRTGLPTATKRPLLLWYDDAEQVWLMWRSDREDAAAVADGALAGLGERHIDIEALRARDEFRSTFGASSGARQRIRDSGSWVPLDAAAYRALPAGLGGHVQSLASASPGHVGTIVRSAIDAGGATEAQGMGVPSVSGQGRASDAPSDTADAPTADGHGHPAHATNPVQATEAARATDPDTGGGGGTCCRFMIDPECHFETFARSGGDLSAAAACLSPWMPICGVCVQCCNSACCGSSCCAGLCCGSTCCGGGCCDPAGGCCSGACCDGVCCPSGNTCCNGQCCAGTCCNGICCGTGSTCCNGQCCSAGFLCCQGVCAPKGACCDYITGVCTETTQLCCQNQGGTYQGDGTQCQPPTLCQPKCDNCAPYQRTFYECQHVGDVPNGTPCSTTVCIENIIDTDCCDYYQSRIGPPNCNARVVPGGAARQINRAANGTCGGQVVQWNTFRACTFGCPGCVVQLFEEACAIPACDGAPTGEEFPVGIKSQCGCP